MKYIEVDVRTAFIIHGYDDNNKEISEKVNQQEYLKKLLSVHRIQSVSEDYILVSSSHGRVMYWEYKGSLADIKMKLKSSGLMLA
jgi:hypothetical protein